MLDILLWIFVMEVIGWFLSLIVVSIKKRNNLVIINVKKEIKGCIIYNIY